MFRRTKSGDKETLSYDTQDSQSAAASPYKFDLPSPHAFEKKSSAFSREEPETTIGEGVIFKGELTFERCLRIDGIFEGVLHSHGKIIIGPKGSVKANITLREALIEGRLEGNLTVEESVELRGEAEVIGDIKAKSLSIEEGVSLVGFVQVTYKE